MGGRDGGRNAREREGGKEGGKEGRREEGKGGRKEAHSWEPNQYTCRHFTPHRP